MAAFTQDGTVVISGPGSITDDDLQYEIDRFLTLQNNQ